MALIVKQIPFPSQKKTLASSVGYFQKILWPFRNADFCFLAKLRRRRKFVKPCNRAETKPKTKKTPLSHSSDRMLQYSLNRSGQRHSIPPSCEHHSNSSICAPPGRRNAAADNSPPRSASPAFLRATSNN